MVLLTWVLLTAARQEIKKEKGKKINNNFLTPINIWLSLFYYYLLGETLSFRHAHTVIFSRSDSNFPTSIPAFSTWEFSLRGIYRPTRSLLCSVYY